MTVLSFIMGIPILEGCIFILEMPPGGQHEKDYTRFSVYFWVKVFYTVSGYAIMEMYPNAWNI